MTSRVPKGWWFRARRTLALAVVSSALLPRLASGLDPSHPLEEYCLRSWGEPDGLPHGSVWAVRQTQDGYLWLGTQAGLARFDGTRFTVFDDTTDDAIRENAIHALAEGRGTLFVAPIRDEPLRRNENGFARLAGFLPAAWKGHGIGDLLVAADGQLYATANGGLARATPGARPELLLPAEMPLDLSLVRRRILEDRAGRIVWASPGGVWRLEGEKPRLAAAIPGATALAADPDGSLWVGTDAGDLFRVQGDRAQRVIPGQRLGGHRTTALVLDSDGTLWLGGRGGVHRLRPSERRSGRLERLPGVTAVQDLAFDSRGALWIATRGGLYCLRDPAFQHDSPSSEAREVLSLAEDGAGTLWFVSREAQRLWRSREGRSVLVPEHELPSSVHALSVYGDAAGTLWLGAEAGLYRRNGRRFARIPGSPAGVTTMLSAAGGALWLADAQGNLHERLGEGPFLKFGRESGLPGRQISSLCLARDGALWVATHDGVYRRRPPGGRFEEVRLGGREGHRFARHVTEDSSGRLWISTRAGLVRVEAGSITAYGRREGLPDTVVNAVIDDGEGGLWLSCPRGLFRLAQSELAASGTGASLRPTQWLLGRCDRDAVLWSRTSAVLRARDGTLWFATALGPFSLPKGTIAAPGPAPVVGIEEVIVDDRRLAGPRGPLELPAGTSQIAIRFTAPSLESPELLAFRYRLLGHQTRWITGAPQRAAHYARLPPGRYTFQVAAAAGGAWNPIATQLDLVLPPLWHQRSSIRAIPWLLLFALPLVAFRWRLSRHRRRERELEQGVSERTNALSEQIRERALVEEALRRSEERYALAVRGTNDGIWDWDLSTGRIYYSPGFEAILGYRPGELGDRPAGWLLRIHPEDVDSVQTKLVAVQQTGQAQLEDEHRVRQKDGTLRWTSMRASVVRNDSGEALRLVGTLSDVTYRRAYDSVTGTPNRFYLVERVRDSLDRKRRQPDYAFAVLAVDLDQFGLVNNSLGYQGSDRLLAEVARRLEGGLRPGDVVGRFGGDEFVVILSDVSGLQETQAVAERLQQAIAEPFEIDGREIYTSISIGIAPALAGYDDPEDLVRDADTALRRVKAWGRGRCGVFDERMRLQSTARLELEGELRRAGERDELRVHYQPVVTPADGRIAGFEALVRWNHPSRGQLSPSEFIVLAEETGQVVSIGNRVLAEACRQARLWSESRPQGGPFVSVNISARQFAEAGFVDHVRETLAETGCPPGALHLEITETTLLRADRNVIETLGRLRQLQLHLAVDDFGTGYSSLGYLERFPIDLLKIDRSFVAGMGPRGERPAIVRMMIALARDLELLAVAEGVETQAQRDLLVGLGCQFAQGHFFAEAVDAERATELLQRSPSADRSGFQTTLFG